MLRINQLICARVARIAAVASLAVALPALAVDVNPGDVSVPLPGSLNPGTVIRDEIIPFEIRSPFNVLLFEGRLQGRIQRRADGRLNFGYFIRDTTPGLNGFVNRFDTIDYSGFATDIDWDPSSLGTQAPQFASRSLDGSNVNISWGTSGVFSGTESEFLYIDTDAEQFLLDGSTTIRLQTGDSVTLTTPRPIRDTTPPIARIDMPDGLECSCSPVLIKGVADDPDGTFDSYVVEHRLATDATWTTIASSNSPVPEPGATLASWNTSGVTEGYHLIRLNVVNTFGLSATDVTVVWVSRDFDTATFGVPTIAGQTVCPSGTVQDFQCSETYTIGYRPATSIGAFTPIDPLNPVYFGGRTNQTLGLWESTTVPDGDYTLLLTGENECGQIRTDRENVTIDNTAPLVRIDSPRNCDRVGSSVVRVTGVVNDAHLAAWTLSYTGGNANGWVTIASGTSNVSGTLAVWDVSNLRTCCYTLRLTASDASVLNCNGAINNRTTYLTSVAVGCEADFDGDGDQDVNDLLAFLSFWFQMCP